MRTTRTHTQHDSVHYSALALIFVLLVGVVGACDEGMTPRRGLYEAVTYGVVKTEAGDPVSDATIRIIALLDESEGPTTRFGPVASNDTGQFNENMRLLGRSDILEITIEAEAPPGSGLADTTFTVEPVDLEFRANPPYDSLRVDVVLPPAPSEDE